MLYNKASIQVLTFDFDGLVIINRVGHMREALSQLPDSTRTGKCILKVGAGQSLQQLALASARLGWSGLEFAAGIPASVGGMYSHHHIGSPQCKHCAIERLLGIFIDCTAALQEPFAAMQGRMGRRCLLSWRRCY